MRRTIRHLGGILLICAFQVSRGQDIHLSQFEFSPLFLNPALGGQYHGDWRIGNTLREQWRSIEKPYQSAVLFLDRRFFYFSRELNAGAIYIHDRSGVGQLAAEKFYFNLAIPILKGRSTVSAGIQPGIVMKYYTNDLTFPEQYDHSIGYFNPEMPNNEGSNYGNTQVVYFDMNAGILWRMVLPGIRPEVGISFMHINQAQESFNNNSSQMPIRENIHGNANIPMKGDLYLKPSFSFSSQNKANQLIAGTEFGRLFRNKKADIKGVFAGIYVRNGYNRNNDSFIPVAGLQYLNWRAGMNYDINISDLRKASNNRGAFEFAIIYTAPDTSPKHTAIPCDRY